MPFGLGYGIPFSAFINALTALLKANKRDKTGT
jgi:hypothetical protein